MVFAGPRQLLADGCINLEKVWPHGVANPDLAVGHAAVVTEGFGDAEQSGVHFELAANTP